MKRLQTYFIKIAAIDEQHQRQIETRMLQNKFIVNRVITN
jgi:hypothetical protein